MYRLTSGTLPFLDTDGEDAGAQAGILHFELESGDYETIIAITHSKLAVEFYALHRAITNAVHTLEAKVTLLTATILRWLADTLATAAWQRR